MAHFVGTIGAAIVAMAAFAANAHASPITVIGVGDKTGSWARESWTPPIETDFVDPLMGEGEASRTATAGTSDAQTGLIYSSTEQSSTFDIAFDHVFGAPDGSFARSSISTLRFTTDEDVEFALDGFYQTFGLGRSVFKVVVVDNTTGDLIADYAYDTSMALDQSIVLGGAYSPNGTVLQHKEDGSLSGVLAAGGDYRIYFDAFTITQGGGGGGTATGAFSFAVSSLTPVQSVASIGAVSEPAGLAVLALGLIGLAAIGRRAR